MNLQSIRARQLAGIGVAITTMLIGLVGTPTAAFAATCYSGSCTGKDPQSTGCSTAGARTIDDLMDQGYYVELRSSATCKAMWTRMSSDGYWNTTGRAWIEERSSGTKYYTTTLANDSTDTVWTKMYNGSQYLRACLYTTNNGTGYKATFCTSWH